MQVGGRIEECVVGAKRMRRGRRYADVHLSSVVRMGVCGWITVVKAKGLRRRGVFMLYSYG